MSNINEADYPVVRNLPVARFYYKGHHSHPVRRTVLVTESNSNIITGYELREGSDIRPFTDAPIKSFSRGKIASVGECGRRLRARTPKKYHAETTLDRSGLLDLVQAGI